jgi:hypothetical protein
VNPVGTWRSYHNKTHLGDSPRYAVAHEMQDCSNANGVLAETDEKESSWWLGGSVDDAVELVEMLSWTIEVW